jgi:hypothetical protein
MALRGVCAPSFLVLEAKCGVVALERANVVHHHASIPARVVDDVFFFLSISPVTFIYILLF